MIAGYPGSDERERELEDLAAKAGGSIVEVGRSVANRAIRAVRVPLPNAPKVLVNANIHGPEWIGSRVAMGVLRAIADGHALRSRAEVVVVPCINVDGYARVEACDGRGSLKHMRCNDNGVDLNRNFPVPTAPSNWIVRNISVRFGGSGSSDPKSAAYRGTSPAS